MYDKYLINVTSHDLDPFFLSEKVTPSLPFPRA